MLVEASLCLEAAERPQWPRVYSLDRSRSHNVDSGHLFYSVIAQLTNLHPVI